MHRNKLEYNAEKKKNVETAGLRTCHKYCSKSFDTNRFSCNIEVTFL